jgi:hypothetical protein
MRLEYGVQPFGIFRMKKEAFNTEFTEAAAEGNSGEK